LSSFLNIYTEFPGSPRPGGSSRREGEIVRGVSRFVARPRVVLDANALMLPFEFRVNLDAELARVLGACDVFVPSSVVGELERLAEKNRGAKAAVQLAAKYEIYKTARRGDVAVVHAAKDLGATVVTSDAALLRILRHERIPRITLRGRSHLILEP